MIFMANTSTSSFWEYEYLYNTPLNGVGVNSFVFPFRCNDNNETEKKINSYFFIFVFGYSIVYVSRPYVHMYVKVCIW